jgi:glycosyltransferase involved in cell wall biosynthesis
VRVLLIAFYFPPAGGGGVQRPLKLAAHLQQLGVEVHVLAPDDPRWIHRDAELRVPAGVRVHRVRYVGPRGRLPAEELYGLAGLARLTRRLALTPRRFVLPDENAPWVLTAVPAAVKLVRTTKIDVMVTTSPPNSIHLIGAAVQRATGVPWVADLRDSMVAKSDRHVERLAVRIKEKGHGALARLVAGRASAVVATTPTIGAEMHALNPALRVEVIPNGADFDDFEGLVYARGEKFRITHTGSFFGKRDPRPFLRALHMSDPAVVARFVGDFRAADRDWARQLELGERLELHPFLPHSQAVAMQRDSEALLLLLPEIGERGIDVPSGKLFEYLAAARPILAAVPPSGAAAALVEEANAGIVAAPDDEDAIAAALETLARQWRAGTLTAPVLDERLRVRVDRFSRSREFANLLRDLA